MTEKNALFVDHRETCIATMYSEAQAGEQGQRKEASKYGCVVSIMESSINTATQA